MTASPPLKTLIKELLNIGRMISQFGWAPASDGNISMRLSDGALIITRSGSVMGNLTKGDLVRAPLSGTDDIPVGASSEFLMHRAVYRMRPEVNAVIHAHPPGIVACSLAGIDLSKPYLPEVEMAVGRVGIAEFAAPSSAAGAQKVMSLIGNCDAVVLYRHGALSVGSEIGEALHRLERLEFAAEAILAAFAVTNPTELTPEQLRSLRKSGENYMNNKG